MKEYTDTRTTIARLVGCSRKVVYGCAKRLGLPCRLVHIEGEIGAPKWRFTPAEKQKLLKALGGPGPGCNVTAIMKEAGCSRANVRRYAEELGLNRRVLQDRAWKRWFTPTEKQKLLKTIGDPGEKRSECGRKSCLATWASKTPKQRAEHVRKMNRGNGRVSHPEVIGHFWLKWFKKRKRWKGPIRAQIQHDGLDSHRFDRGVKDVVKTPQGLRDFLLEMDIHPAHFRPEQRQRDDRERRKAQRDGHQVARVDPEGLKRMEADLVAAGYDLSREGVERLRGEMAEDLRLVGDWTEDDDEQERRWFEKRGKPLPDWLAGPEEGLEAQQKRHEERAKYKERRRIKRNATTYITRRKRKAAETPKERAARLAKAKARRAAETPEKRTARLAAKNATAKAKRTTRKEKVA